MNIKNLLIISGFLIASSQASSQGIDVNRALDRAYDAISDNFDQSSDRLVESVNRSRSSNQSQSNTQPQRSSASARRFPNGNTFDPSGSYEIWDITVLGLKRPLNARLVLHNDCSLSFSSPAFTFDTDAQRNFDSIVFNTRFEDFAVSFSGKFSTRSQLSGEMTITNFSDSTRSGSFEANGTLDEPYTARFNPGGGIPGRCITDSPTELSPPATPINSANQNDRASNLVEDLNRLTDLFEEGLLNEEEFNAAKRRLLGL